MNVTRAAKPFEKIMRASHYPRSRRIPPSTVQSRREMLTKCGTWMIKIESAAYEEWQRNSAWARTAFLESWGASRLCVVTRSASVESISSSKSKRKVDFKDRGRCFVWPRVSAFARWCSLTRKYLLAVGGMYLQQLQLPPCPWKRTDGSRKWKCPEHPCQIR